MMETMLKIDPHNLDFDLPAELIAQEALEKRDQARFMILNREHHTIIHKNFFDVLGTLSSDDVLVLNQAKVSRLKVQGRKKTGGHVEIVFIAPTEKSAVWRALVRPLLKDGTVISIAENIDCVLVGRTATGENLLEIKGADMDTLLAQHGRLPMPPYIKREEQDVRSQKDELLYQTVYATHPGSIAAPTAGLHFTPELLSEIAAKGVEILKLTLHVGWGTFKPVSSLDQHVMLPESYEISANTWKSLKRARELKKRIIAVGTTVTRVLESLTGEEADGAIQGHTNIFIRPGFQFQWVSALITNFHVPRSTPISLVSAFAGTSLIEKAYAQAIEQRYRFFSYGDAMLIE